MSVLMRSRIFACLPFCSRVYKLRTGDLCTITCASFRYSSHRSCNSTFTPRFHSSSLTQRQRTTCTHSKCSAAGISHFQDMMSFRDKQAKHSVVIELSSKEDIPCILNLCKHYGDIKNMIAYHVTSILQEKIQEPNDLSGAKYVKGVRGGSGKNVTKLQVIAEYVHEESVQKLLSDCSFRNVSECFPVHSRFLRFRNRGQNEHAVITSDEVIDLSCETDSFTRKEPCSISEMMIELYEREKMTDLSTRQRFLSCVILKDALKGMFPHCAIFPFGSSVNGLGKDSSDLDMMLRLYPEQVSKNSELFFQAKMANGSSRVLQQHSIMGLYAILLNFIPAAISFRKVMTARMPIVKYYHQLLNLECDVSVNNMAGVYMAEILFFCGELDPRVRPLMYTVKKWAALSNITFSTPGGWITNFSLSLLVLYFLQTRPIPILPPLNKVIRIPSADDKLFGAECVGVEYVNAENLKSAVSGQNTESLGTLLKEFFRFLATFPFDEKRISVIAGDASLCKSIYSMWVDYPLDETLNVTKNIVPTELINLSKSAFAAVNNLEKNSNVLATDLMASLGLKQSSSKRIDVWSFFDESSDQKKAITRVP